VALFGWIMMGIAIWHFTVFLPDRFWAGIIGGFVGAVIGAVFFALLIHGFNLPSQDDTNVLTILEAVPGTLVGLAVVWFLGVRQERSQGEPLDAFGRSIAH
jgi:predicted membrane-bound spermidine synthase